MSTDNFTKSEILNTSVRHAAFCYILQREHGKCTQRIQYKNYQEVREMSVIAIDTFAVAA